MGFGLKFGNASDEDQVMLNIWRDYLQAHQKH
jgi:hypothetical protein